MSGLKGRYHKYKKLYTMVTIVAIFFCFDFLDKMYTIIYNIYSSVWIVFNILINIKMNETFFGRIDYPRTARPKPKLRPIETQLELNLSERINSLEEALWYIRKISLRCLSKCDKLWTAKYKTFWGAYKNFVKTLKISSRAPSGNAWTFETVQTISNLVGIGDNPKLMTKRNKQDIINKVIREANNPNRSEEVREFLSQLERTYITSKYTKKVS